jgi:DNA repair protein RecN (Recombination protein N)
MERVNAEIQEVLAGLQDLAAEIENSDESLQNVDERLFTLKAQARKHGCTINNLSAKRDEIAQALNAIENQDSLMAELMQKTKAAKKEFYELAITLSNSRKKVADKMAKLIMKELVPLKLEKTRFEVNFETLEEQNWNDRGLDKIQFFVATNPGAEAGPLNKIASGGEMSRLMLALKVVLSEVGEASCLIFDEVDSGIGGATAAAVGARLAELARNNQVLVITHSPQVAAIAKHHWIVSKEGADKVITNVIALSKAEQRQEEIARMLAGSEITPEARAAANKLLEASAA